MSVSNKQQTVAGGTMEPINAHELYMVGRHPGKAGSPLTSALAEWMDTLELGHISDMLVSSDFLKMVSVLVMQQYLITTTQPALGPAVPMTDDPVRQYVTNANLRTSAVLDGNQMRSYALCLDCCRLQCCRHGHHDHEHRRVSARACPAAVPSPQWSARLHVLATHLAASAHLLAMRHSSLPQCVEQEG
jgi:hypothetical protein